eukprot:scaffold7790_cov229-Pinguiococcus_pyrenoidosus.AAC.1
MRFSNLHFKTQAAPFSPQGQKIVARTRHYGPRARRSKLRPRGPTERRRAGAECGRTRVAPDQAAGRGRLRSGVPPEGRRDGRGSGAEEDVRERPGGAARRADGGDAPGPDSAPQCGAAAGPRERRRRAVHVAGVLRGREPAQLPEQAAAAAPAAAQHRADHPGDRGGRAGQSAHHDASENPPRPQAGERAHQERPLVLPLRLRQRRGLARAAQLCFREGRGGRAAGAHHHADVPRPGDGGPVPRAAAGHRHGPLGPGLHLARAAVRPPALRGGQQPGHPQLRRVCRRVQGAPGADGLSVQPPVRRAAGAAAGPGRGVARAHHRGHQLLQGAAHAGQAAAGAGRAAQAQAVQRGGARAGQGEDARPEGPERPARPPPRRQRPEQRQLRRCAPSGGAAWKGSGRTRGR